MKCCNRLVRRFRFLEHDERQEPVCVLPPERLVEFPEQGREVVPVEKRHPSGLLELPEGRQGLLYVYDGLLTGRLPHDDVDDEIHTSFEIVRSDFQKVAVYPNVCLLGEKSLVHVNHRPE